jgi:hypothetical protein
VKWATTHTPSIGPRTNIARCIHPVAARWGFEVFMRATNGAAPTANPPGPLKEAGWQAFLPLVMARARRSCLARELGDVRVLI